MLSGPATGTGALDEVARQAGKDDLISMEIGGTSCDVIMMHGGTAPMADDLLVAGYHVATPAVEIHTVGAGVGTIAEVDEGGLLKVGPAGAGARPGPVSYGLGGTEPTVTDALPLLGRLRPGDYAGGTVPLDAERARHSIDKIIARPLGTDTEAAAIGMIRLLEQNLLHAVERISIERGHDPRRCLMAAVGGAGPMFGAEVGRRLGVASVYAPRRAGAFCTEGMLNADVRCDFMTVLFDDLDTIAAQTAETAFAALKGQAITALDAESFGANDRRLERPLDLRYGGQQWSLRVAAPDFDRSLIGAAFEANHQRMFGHIQPDGALQITVLRVTGRGLIERAETPPLARVSNQPVPRGHRPVHGGDTGGWCDTPVYVGAALHRGHMLEGSLIIKEATTTPFAGQGDQVYRSSHQKAV